MCRDESLIEQRWNAEYRKGRYFNEQPVAMIGRILAAAHSKDITEGLYIGCGNGRNYIPLHEAGLSLLGIDISAKAVAQLRQLLPGLPAGQLRHGTVRDLPAGMMFPLVIGIQVFQHGTAAEATAHIQSAASRVAPGGLFAIRVNAVGTDVYPAHRIVEERDGGFTVKYLEGPKKELNVHFFSGPEMGGILRSLGFSEVETMHRVRHQRVPPEPGSWCQWEGIWERPG